MTVWSINNIVAILLTLVVMHSFIETKKMCWSVSNYCLKVPYWNTMCGAVLPQEFKNVYLITTLFDSTTTLVCIMFLVTIQRYGTLTFGYT